jgi:hypothetical protein
MEARTHSNEMRVRYLQDVAGAVGLMSRYLADCAGP